MMEEFPAALLQVISPEDLHYRPVRRSLSPPEVSLIAAIAARSVLVQPFWEKLANAAVIGECTYGCPCLLLALADPASAPITALASWARAKLAQAQTASLTFVFGMVALPNWNFVQIRDTALLCQFPRLFGSTAIPYPGEIRDVTFMGSSLTTLRSCDARLDNAAVAGCMGPAAFLLVR